MNETPKPSVHDNVLVSYEVHCQRREIRLHTEFRDRGEPFESTDVVFSGVVCYDFCHDSDVGTILFGIEEVPAVDIYEEHAEQLRAGVRYGWPGPWAEDAESAAAFFQQGGIRGFEIHPSLGMGGWVLARDMSLITGSPLPVA